MYDITLPYQDIRLRSQAEEPSAQNSVFDKSIPRQSFTELHASSDASLAAPPYATTTLHGTRFESNDGSAQWGSNAIYLQPKLEALDMDGLGWIQRPNTTSPTFDYDPDLDYMQSDLGSPVDYKDYPASEWSSMYAFSDLQSLSPVQPCAQPDIDGILYRPNFEDDPWTSLRSTSSIQPNHGLGRSDFAEPFSRFNHPRTRALEVAPSWTGTDESFQLLDHASSTPCPGFESGCQLSSLHSYTNNTMYAPCDGTATDPELIAHAAYEPGSDFPGDVDSKLTCPYIDCGEQFANAADCKRHFNTFHDKDRQSYRCAHDGCVRAYKVWNRLDSFRKHAKRHHLDESQITVLVQRSRNRKQNGLHVALTTQKELSKIRTNELGSRLTKSHTLLK